MAVDQELFRGLGVGGWCLAGLMEAIRSIEEMSGSELLDHVDDLARTQRRAEAEILRAAVQHAIINNPETLDPELAKLPGRERAQRFGGVGTPQVANFCCAELGARLGVSPWSAHALIADALDLVIRLPRLWARVEALEVKASYARHVARKTRDLTLDQAAYVDERVVESADGRIPWSRFEEVVEAAVTAADTWAAACREDEARRRVYANPTRSSENGMRGFYIRAPFPVIARLDATVAYVAEALTALGDPDPVDARRVKAILILANPTQATELLAAYRAWRERPADTAGQQPEVDWSKLLPAVQILVHMYAGTPDAPSEGVARVDGVGPVTEHYVRRHLTHAAKVTVRPVLDIEVQAPVDSYEIPDSHRVAVQVMSPADVFPYATNTAWQGKQIDHTKEYDSNAPPGAGQSRIGNYGPMTGFHHRIKTHGQWQVQQPFPGIYIWRDPHGAYYVVDHTGTRRIDNAA